jgi:MOSC domain-containing protein YiiM
MEQPVNRGSVVAVCKKAQHGIPKISVEAIHLLENYGVEGDYHAGKFVRHRYLARKDPNVPNVRQVLLIDTSILSFLADQDIHLEPGMMGENLLLDGISVMELPLGTQLEVGESLLEIRNAGMLARILQSGWVRPGDSVLIRPNSGAEKGV